MSKRVVMTAMVGNILEYYDFMLYSLFVSILAPIFFPSTDPMAALLSGFGVFALGFLARPIGAIAFGFIGDKWGRKRALSLSILLMAIPTGVIGLLPTYDRIGIFASIALIICRILQGFSAGGEANGASIYTLEHTPLERRGYLGSLITSSAGVGALIATIIGVIFTSDALPEWAWRVPFLLGSCGGLIGIYLRRQMTETPEFTPCKKAPFWEVIKSHSFVKTLAVGSLLQVPYYMIVGFMNPTLHTKGIITKFEMMCGNGLITLIGIFLIPLFGKFADHYGLERTMKRSAIALILMVFPVFILVESTTSVPLLFLAQVLLILPAEGFVGPANGYLNTLFKPEHRYTGIAFGCCLGMALFAGTTPLICTHLTNLVGPIWGPASYMIAIGLAVLFVLRQPRTSAGSLAFDHR